jgi:Ser/Thr protein kinase RdoA (MazF antagonist)
MSVFTTPPPALSEPEIQDLVRRHYGLEGDVSPLISERDDNARLRVGGQSYVLKISNAAEDPAQIALQNAAMIHLERTGPSSLPQLVRTLSGTATAVVPVNGADSMIRLVTWVLG